MRRSDDDLRYPPELTGRTGFKNFTWTTEAIADWLTDNTAMPDLPAALRGWDLLQFDGIDSADKAMAALVSHLWSRGNTVRREEGDSCWRIELPAQWSDYEARLSKSNRKLARRLQKRQFDTGRAVLHTAADDEQFDRGFEILVDWHQRRWQSRGEAGCAAAVGTVPDMASRGPLAWWRVVGAVGAVVFGVAG